MIDPAKVCLYVPPELKATKLALFKRIASHIHALGGTSTTEAVDLERLPNEVIPIVGCSPQLTKMIGQWQARQRPWIYWDRGYARRVYATWLPRGDGGGYYRWHLNSYQMQTIRDVPGDRWKALNTPHAPWRAGAKHVLIAKPSNTYMRFHGLEGWLDRTVYSLSLLTDRQLVVRDKESKRDLRHDLASAHACVTHGSIAAVEAVIMGCPVFVDPSSAAALVGQTDISLIEKPIYPEREAWLRSLAYCQFNERELVDGTLWRLMQ